MSRRDPKSRKRGAPTAEDPSPVPASAPAPSPAEPIKNANALAQQLEAASDVLENGSSDRPKRARTRRGDSGSLDSLTGSPVAAAIKTPGDASPAKGANRAENDSPAPFSLPAAVSSTSASPSLSGSSGPPGSSLVPYTGAGLYGVGPAIKLDRGYQAHFFWDHYRPFWNRKPSARSIRPSCTDVVGSIPMLFYMILRCVADIEREVRGREILPLVDRKLLKPLNGPAVDDINSGLLAAAVAPPPSAAEDSEATEGPAPDLGKRYILQDGEGNEYLVNACRKEHVKMLFESGGFFSRLGLCPQLIDIWNVNAGKRNLLAGAHLTRNQAATGTTGVKNEFKCHCALLEAEQSAEAEAKTSPPELKDQTTPAASPNGSTVVELQPFDSALTALGLADALDPSDPLVSHSDETGGPGSVSESEREKWRKKLAAQARALSVLTEQLKAAHQRSNEIENKWKEERDLNVRMWEKVISVQRHIRQISRPLTTELALQGRL